MRIPVRSFFTAALLAAFLLPAGLSAQVSLAFGGGLVSSTLTGDGLEGDVDSSTGFSFGGWLGFPISDRVSIAPGLVYVQKGAAESAGSDEIELAVDYIEIPVVLGVRLTGPDSNTSFSLFGGPALGLKASCEVEGSDGGVTISVDCDEFDDDFLEDFDFGAVIGANVQFPAGNNRFIWVSGGAEFGLANINAETDGDTVRNRAFFLSAGVGFLVGG